jgi:hypothetical protein
LSINFFILNAKDKVTANGRPSGIATTIIETHNIIMSNIFFGICFFGSVNLSASSLKDFEFVYYNF